MAKFYSREKSKDYVKEAEDDDQFKRMFLDYLDTKGVYSDKEQLFVHKLSTHSSLTVPTDEGLYVAHPTLAYPPEIRRHSPLLPCAKGLRGAPHRDEQRATHVAVQPPRPGRTVDACGC